MSVNPVDPAELAKATGEIARTTGKAVDAAREFGGYFAPIVKQPLEQLAGIFEDKLRYLRWERQVRLAERAAQFLRERGAKDTRSVPLKFLIPLLEAASLEEDNRLQDLYAHLLANAADAESDIRPVRAFVAVLQECTSIEVHLLDFMRRMSILSDIDTPYNILTFVEYFRSQKINLNVEITQDMFRVPLWNLFRLGCIAPFGGFGSGSGTLDIVRLTPFGLALANASMEKAST